MATAIRFEVWTGCEQWSERIGECLTENLEANELSHGCGEYAPPRRQCALAMWVAQDKVLLLEEAPVELAYVLLTINRRVPPTRYRN